MTALLGHLGGAPTFLLTDNEKTVIVEDVAGMPVRNPQIVAFSGHCGLTVHTCEPAEPASKGGSESTVKIAKADLVPKDSNLLEAYGSFAELEAACEVFCREVNAREHRVTRRVPDEMLEQEQARLHPIPADPHTVAYGVTRTVPASMPMVSFENGQYSVPARCSVKACGCGSTATVPTSRWSSCTSQRIDLPRWPGTGGPPRVARRLRTRTSRPPRPGRWSDPPRGLLEAVRVLLRRVVTERGQRRRCSRIRWVRCR